MPAGRFGASPIDIAPLDVMGFDAAHRVNFISHVGLANSRHPQFVTGTYADLVDMQPPLHRGGNPVQAQTWGSVPLTVDEQNRINLFIDERIDEHRAASARKVDQYIIRPHTLPRCDADGTVLYWLYSCVGFVVEAYRVAGLDIIVTDEARLPPVTLAMIESAYGTIREVLRGRFGIPGTGNWPVLMAGYVLHALNRTSSEIRSTPYQPQIGDEVFP